MSFDALNAEVDRQALSLRRHAWGYFPWWTGQRWNWISACTECGRKFEVFVRRQICLGVIGELMLAHERVPTRWGHGFRNRVRVARRAWKPKKKGGTRR